MAGVEIRELECFLVLAEELHFGRAGERLFISQSRVSQLLRSLERRVGARLVDRTSRRVGLTPFGEEFAASLRPAYEALAATVDRARAAAREEAVRIRVGFQGLIYAGVAEAVVDFHGRFPGHRVDLTEIPLSDPFGALRAGELEAAVVLLPVEEPDLRVLARLPDQRQMVAVQAGNALSGRETVAAEELAGLSLVPLSGDAPDYWKRAQSPVATPRGRPIPQESGVSTLQEGLTRVASGLGAMMLCEATAEHNRRDDVAYVPVDGMPPSRLALVGRADGGTPELRALAKAVEGGYWG